MSQGTPLGDLNGGGMPMQADSDNDLVKRIMSDMNIPIDNGVGNLPPAPSGRSMSQMINDPNPNTVTQYSMDNGPATAHVIGNHHPSAAEFGALLPGHVGVGGSPMAANAAFYNTPVMQPQIQYIQAPSQSMFSSFNSVNIFREMKLPLFVAILFAFMSLPVINAMIGHYLPNLLKVGGDLTTMGLVFKSLLAGSAFWILQRVLVPLVAP
jgi:hypothetical protein